MGLWLWSGAWGGGLGRSSVWGFLQRYRDWDVFIRVPLVVPLKVSSRVVTPGDNRGISAEAAP